MNKLDTNFSGFENVELYTLLASIRTHVTLLLCHIGMAGAVDMVEGACFTSFVLAGFRRQKGKEVYIKSVFHLCPSAA
jgi:hypothetical protein